MTLATFSINIDPAADLVRIKLAGFFTEVDIAHFQKELGAAHRQIGCRHKGGPLTLNDVSEMALQSQDAVAQWSRFMADPSHRSRRLAFVVSSTLARLQLQRIIGDRAAQVFADTKTAECWLLSEEPVPLVTADS